MYTFELKTYNINCLLTDLAHGGDQVILWGGATTAEATVEYLQDLAC